MARFEVPARPGARLAAPPCPLPSRLGDDHLGADLVEALPELGALQVHPRRLRRGQRRAGPGALGGASGGGGRGGRQEPLLAAACGESGGSESGRGSADSPSRAPSSPGRAASPAAATARPASAPGRGRAERRDRGSTAGLAGSGCPSAAAGGPSGVRGRRRIALAA